MKSLAGRGRGRGRGRGIKNLGFRKQVSNGGRKDGIPRFWLAIERERGVLVCMWPLEALSRGRGKIRSKLGIQLLTGRSRLPPPPPRQPTLGYAWWASLAGF